MGELFQMKSTIFALILTLLALSGTLRAQQPQTIFAQAVRDYEAGKFAEAAAGFKKTVEASPKNAEAQIYLGNALYELKKPDEAVAAYEAAIRLKPNSSEAHFGLGRIYYEREEYEKSLPLVEKSHKLNSKWTAPMVLLGDNYRKLGNLKKAVIPYQRALGFDDKNPQTYLGLGLTYVELNNKIAARQQLKKLEAIDKGLAEQLKKAIDR
jgi:tetratricopeptide (TPR) repeat protein